MEMSGVRDLQGPQCELLEETGLTVQYDRDRIYCRKESPSEKIKIKIVQHFCRRSRKR